MVVLGLLAVAVAAFGVAAGAAVARRAVLTGAAASAFLLSGGLGLHVATYDPLPQRDVADIAALRPRVPLLVDRPQVTPSPPPRGTLEVFADGCGVVRSDFGGKPPQGLTWQVSDLDGFQVLGRNALGETRYRYFRPGTYTVVLEAFHDGRYVPVSNEVTIRC